MIKLVTTTQDLFLQNLKKNYMLNFPLLIFINPYKICSKTKINKNAIPFR